MPNFVEVHSDLIRHPKLPKLARALNFKCVYAQGYVIQLWLWAMLDAPDGDVSRFAIRYIAQACYWEGEPEQFIEALVECGFKDKPGFLERAGDQLLIHDWNNPRGLLRVPHLLPGRLPWFLWSLKRQFVFLRDDYTCQYCGKDLSSGAEPIECDHIIPISRGGSNDTSNLATACLGCNRAKSNKTPQEWQR